MLDMRKYCLQQGFTLVELAVTVIIVGVIVAITLPNLIRLQSRAKEASVKANMHTLQLALEDFAVQTGGHYPDDATSTTPGGETVEDLCPGGTYPTNPFTEAPTVVAWDADPANPGQIAINPATTSGYLIKGFGSSMMLLLELTPGQ